MIINNKPAKLTLAHINDTHSYFEPQALPLKLSIDGQEISPYVSNGGFSRIATRVKQLKVIAAEKNSPFLFLHARDCFKVPYIFHYLRAKQTPKCSMH
ncbi:hypothetical protein [Psychromonas sp. KJ10-2]|uniref:hypothetical protein n=1 Tax=Psychromonas sp. KJ10-2 TaxID=3391822 RepID=UPI0039B545E1